MITLDEYKLRAAATESRALSGIECPDCKAELDWAERQLFSREPPMRRLVCPACGFSEVVPAEPESV